MIQFNNFSIKYGTYNAKDSLVGNDYMWDVREAGTVEIHSVPYELHSIGSFTVFNDPGILVCRKKCNVCRDEDATPNTIGLATGGEVGIVPPDVSTACVHRYYLYLIVIFILDRNDALW
jgi:hypothetical protein